MKKTEKEFEFVNRIVNFHWERAIGLANLESLLTYWSVGRFLSSRLKAATWGSKTIEELSDYLQRRNARLRGYGKRQLYNMVEFYEAYTSDEFANITRRLRLDEFVQLPTAQLAMPCTKGEFVQLRLSRSMSARRTCIWRRLTGKYAERGRIRQSALFCVRWRTDAVSPIP